MEQPLISVIVPVYKVEAYLDQCVTSIINQTWKNLEVILVDDGSPDACGAMCDVWAERDNRIKAIHKENGGLSDARNAGLDIAAGDYIALIDSDDVADVNMLQLLAQALEQTGADIAACDYVKFETCDALFGPAAATAPAIYDTAQALEELLLERGFHYTVWNKLYRRNIFDGLRFEVGKLHEDVFFTYQAFGASQKIAKIDLPLYGYRQRSGSIMGTAFSLRNLDSLDAREHQLAYMRQCFPSLEGLAQRQLLGNCRYFGQLALRSKNPELRRRAIARIQPIYQKEATPLRFRASAKEYLWLTLGRISFKGCCCLRNRLGIGL